MEYAEEVALCMCMWDWLSRNHTSMFDSLAARLETGAVVSMENASWLGSGSLDSCKDESSINVMKITHVVLSAIRLFCRYPWSFTMLSAQALSKPSTQSLDPSGGTGRSGVVLTIGRLG